MTAHFDLIQLARGAVLAGFLLMALLPRLYFRRGGRLGLRWWLTAAPFGLQAFWMLAAWRGWIPSFEHPHLAVGSLILLTAYFAVLLAATASHSRAPGLWHQSQGASRLTTRGIYGYVRHPLYSAFLLLATAATLAGAHPFAFANLFFCYAALQWTTLVEERQLLESPLAAQYQIYQRCTGQFFPKIGTGLRHA